MKRILLFLSFGIINYGNTIYGQAIRFGIKGGTVLSFPSVKPSLNYQNPHYGFLVGMHLDFAITQKFTTRLEMDFVDKTSNYENNFFLDIPLNFIYKIPVKKNKFLLGGGPVLGIRTSDYDYFDGQYRKTDIGINLLAGFEFEIGFSINMNYTHGVVNMVEKSENFSYTDFRNRMAGITLGYLF